MSRTDATPLPIDPADADGAPGFEETPTTPPAEAALNHLRQIQNDLADVMAEHGKLALKTREIQERVARTVADFTEILRHLDTAPATPKRESAAPPLQFRQASVPAAKAARESNPQTPRRGFEERPQPQRGGSATVSQMARRLFEKVNPKEQLQIPDIAIPVGAEWGPWQDAWETARVRGEFMGVPRLPLCPARLSAVDELLTPLLPRVTDAQLRQFFERFRGFVEDYERARDNLPVFSGCQQLKLHLAKARQSDARGGSYIERSLKAIDVWEEKMNAKHRWSAPDLFDAELTEVLTLAYDDCFATSKEPALQSVCEWVVYFLSLIGVYKDDGLQVGVPHEKLTKNLRDKFPVQSLKAGTSADACKVATIVRNRWFRIADGREIQVVRPWYELA